ncbi:hypothetical protein DCC39_02915 [Pueribacillus theae]|uniref:Type I-B CRISPR-associated protein Cas8b/Csh1 n=1 Tax=Pueribacillus theae TaxID=2171751 RepID=A0A2U1K6C9_9BACI|nr:hypothetical protein [Pueribacillus theae]PWA13096.1 hypothetical protein DCC39_02915 [Pueribacillus theae]
MLLSDIIKIGKPIVESPMPIIERIQLLTDFGKEEVKNFYGHIFLIEIGRDNTGFQFKQFQDEKNGPVDLKKACGIPITLPSGGNPLHAQGVYPIPCYPMYDPHIKNFTDEKKTKKMVHDRLVRTIPYMDQDEKTLEKKVDLITNMLVNEASKYVTEEKQLGVLVILDLSLNIYSNESKEESLFISTSAMDNGSIYIQSSAIFSNIIEARFLEAAELGSENERVSTISNEPSEKVVSAYNKGWLWLSPTWEMPRSIYWKEKEWTKGIRLNRKEYEAFFYGTQFLKQVQTPLHASMLKEMFAPIQNVEAKKNMRPTSFEAIYGIPYFLPLLNKDSIEVYEKFKVLKNRYEEQNMKESDLQLEIISGVQKRMIPELTDDYRLTIIYYSGTMSRGDIHIRGQIEDVVPSVAYQVQRIIKKNVNTLLNRVADQLSIPENQLQFARFKVSHLPTLLSNAYGPGYIWSMMQAVLHREPIGLERVTKQTSRRINELANKEEYWNLRYELLFYHLFIEFYKQYYETVLKEKEGKLSMQQWESILQRYLNGELQSEDLDSTEKIGFVTGCLLQQFERSYRAKTGKSYVDTRVMRFGSKLTPEMIWKNGLLRMQELQKQWDFGIKSNYNHALSLVLPSMIAMKEKQAFTKEKDEFMTMFWSGYLMLPKVKKEETANESK